MLITRRNFITNTALTAGALSLHTLFGKTSLSHFEIEETKRIREFGLQLWTIRDELFKGTDVKELLKKLASFGYRYIESFDGPKGVFWGMKNTEFKKLLTDTGMTIYSSHLHFNENIERKINEAAEIGMKYLIYPSEGPNRTPDDYKKLAEKFNTWGEACKKAGICFAFHNHDFTFKSMNGLYMQDVLMQNTDPSLVDYQMDIFWVVAAGQDPEVWLKKYPNRFRLSHIKDRTQTPDKDEVKNSVDLGTGTIDFPRVLKTARQHGMQYFIVEQEAYPNGSSMEAVKANARYMKKLKA